MESEKYNLLHEIRVKDTHPFWKPLCKEMTKVVWHEDDIIEPYLENTNFYQVFDSDIRFKPMKILLGITNLIDSLVGTIIDDGVREASKLLSHVPYYSDIEFYIFHQSASEIVHMKVYNKQFELFIDSSERDMIKDIASRLLNPLVEAAKETVSSINKLLLCFSIESILIPVIFNYINDLKDIKDGEVVTNTLTKQVLTTIYSANRLILRDEMLHVSGGAEIIRELTKMKMVTRSDLDKYISVVRKVVTDIMIEIDSDKTEVIDALETITYGLYYGRKINYDDYPCLSFIKATFPSIDGFFKGSVTSYANGSKERIDNPKIL